MRERTLSWDFDPPFDAKSEAAIMFKCGGPPVPGAPRSTIQQVKTRLIHMFDAFARSSKREASFEADVVACWASMCTIKHE